MLFFFIVRLQRVYKVHVSGCIKPDRMVAVATTCCMVATDTRGLSI